MKVAKVDFLAEIAEELVDQPAADGNEPPDDQVGGQAVDPGVLAPEKEAVKSQDRESLS